ncbi:hypothetical protein [Paenibacillus solani]|uniref:hypothetical protein n=1 Tax=Paenibacillus solani TaxID=1705565 RepID=UPI003D29E039
MKEDAVNWGDPPLHGSFFRSEMRYKPRGEVSHPQECHRLLKEGNYHPQPVKRQYIPKKDGKQRPLLSDSFYAYAGKNVSRSWISLWETNPATRSPGGG